MIDQRLLKSGGSISAGRLRMFQRYSNSARYFHRCLRETATCVPLMLRLICDQTPSMVFVCTTPRTHYLFGVIDAAEPVAVAVQPVVDRRLVGADERAAF